MMRVRQIFGIFFISVIVSLGLCSATIAVASPLEHVQKFSIEDEFTRNVESKINKSENGDTIRTFTLSAIREIPKEIGESTLRNSLNKIAKNQIRVECKSGIGYPNYYISSPDYNNSKFEPYTLLTLLFGTYHPLTLSPYEGKKYQFKVYNLLDMGYTNIVSSSLVIGFDENGNYYQYNLPAKPLKNLKKPTDEDWKKLKMDLMFTFLLDQDMSAVNLQNTNFKRK